MPTETTAPVTPSGRTTAPTPHPSVPLLGRTDPHPHDRPVVDVRARATEATVLLDARWWHVGGTGAVTRSLLRGLQEVAPEHRWLLWGPDGVADHRWPTGQHLPTTDRPAAWFGQRMAFRVPAADLVVHPHQTRPAHRRPAASTVLDLIQLQHPNRLVRRAMRARLAATVRHAEVLFTIAPSVRDQLVAELGVDAQAVQVLHLPIDATAAAAVGRRRADEDQRGDGELRRSLVAIGGFRPHKNQRRLIEAFAATRFAAEGGRLELVGGDLAELGLGPADVHHGVRALGHVGATELEELLAGALALVQPSLVEGYGLPVAEALAAGVPVVSSPIPAVSEFGPAGIPTFDPRSVTEMAAALDETVELVAADRYWDRVDRAAWLAAQPTDADLACQVLAGIAPVLARAR